MRLCSVMIEPRHEYTRQLRNRHAARHACMRRLNMCMR